MNIEKYLNRINIANDIKPDILTLKKLHLNHLLNIPFENLHIHDNKKVVLESHAVEDKIINNLRGGYCYELNGLFYLLLKEIGYKAKMVSARVNNRKGGWGPEFDHMAIIVELENEWIADVGFGDNFLHPLKFEIDSVRENLNGFYKIVKYDEEYFKLMKSSQGDDFEDEYIFSFREREWSDFNAMNEYQQTSEESHFIQGKVCTIARNNGRVTLTDKKLIITENGKKTETEITCEEDFRKSLFEQFGIKLQ